MPKLFDYVNSASYNKKDLMEDKEDEKAYEPFVVNKAFSNHMDTSLYANEMNRLSLLPKKLQYDFYLHAIKKRKRYGWAKADKIENLDIVQQYFMCNPERAKEIIKFLTPDHIEDIKQTFYTGG